MSERPSFYMAILGDREALGWILREQKMVFGPERWKLWRGLKQGDHLVLYTTRQCFRNPTRDRGRVIATATAASPLGELTPPVIFRELAYEFYCDLEISCLAPWGEGPELASLVSELNTFPSSWRSHIRRSLISLNQNDYQVLADALRASATTREEALNGYLARATPLRPRGHQARTASR